METPPENLGNHDPQDWRYDRNDEHITVARNIITTVGSIYRFEIVSPLWRL